LEGERKHMAGVRTPASLHDVELAALAAAGGRREFGELVRRHGSAVRGLLRRMGAQPSLADDIAQRCAEAEAFMSASGARGFDVRACLAAPTNPDLQVDFVYSFWSSVEPSGVGTRSFGGGVVLDEPGVITVVVSLAANTD
jgi:hypothetical protein